MRKPRIRWTLQRDADLRRYYAWGYSDTSIANVLGCSRMAVTRRRLKLDLGPSQGRPGGKVGQRHKPETIEKMRAARQRLYRENPDYVAKVREANARSQPKAAQVSRHKRWRIPQDPEQRRLFVYLRRIIGGKAAREAVARAGNLPVQANQP